MKKASKLLKRILIAGVLPLLALGSCISEKEVYTPSGDGNSEITFSIMLPGKSVPASRAMSESDENKVDYIDILVFAPGGNYVYTTRCSSNITTDGGNVRKKSFTVKLRQGTFDLVLLANAPSLTGISLDGKNKAAALALIEAGMPVSGKWPADGSRPIPMWGEKSGVAIDETTDLTGTNGVSLARMIARVDVQITGTAVGTFELASVHVYNYNTHGSVAPATGQWDATTDPDKPKTNAPNVPASSVLTKGPLLYDGAAVTATGCASEIYIFEAENHTTTAHTTGKTLLDRTCLVIGGVYDANNDGDFTNDGDPTYYRVDFSTGSGVSQSYLDVLRNHQYIFSITKVSGAGYESPQIAFESGPVNIEANVLQWNEAEFSEIKFDGQYMLGVSPSSVFDFFKSSETQTANIRTTHPDGWKVLKITESDGVTPPVGDWLTTDKTTGTLYGDDGSYTSLDISVDENTIGTDRTGYIYIQAGKLETRLTVKQTTTVPSLLVTLDANDNPVDALEFSGPVGVSLSPQTFKVQWAPKNETLYISTSPVAMPETGSYEPITWFSYLTESGAINNTGADVYVTPISNGSGYAEFTIQPNAITSGEMNDDPFYERAIQVNFRATGGEGLMRKGLLLQQYVYNMHATPENFYLADGSKYTFNVKSNRPWKAYLIDDGEGIVESPAVSTTIPIATGGYNLPNGVNVEFKTLDDLSDPVILTGTAKVRVEWLKGEDPSNDADWDKSTVIDLFCASGDIRPSANCYVLDPSSEIGLLIPVSPANGYREDGTIDPLWPAGLGTRVTEDMQFGAKLIWTDAPNEAKTQGLADDAALRSVIAVGSGLNGYILVFPGLVNKSGNAVVAMTKNPDGTGEVLWSWHIWITDAFTIDGQVNIRGGHFNSGWSEDGTKDGSLWLDRNLGALHNGYQDNTTRETDLSILADAIGVQYQWGRKDPFPGTAALSAAEERELYSETGKIIGSYGSVTHASSGSLVNTVNNPFVYYNTPSWTASANHNLWGNTGGKSVFDPCPAGWRVPIYVSLGWNNASNTKYWGTGSATIGNFSDGNKGINWSKAVPYKGGYYPIAAYRTNTGLNTPANGYCWSASSAGTTYAYALVFNYTQVMPGYSHAIGNYAMNIRCVKDE